MTGRDAPRTAPGDAADASEATAYAIEAIIARLLVIGTYIAIGLVLVGVVLALAHGSDPLASAAAPFELGRIPADIVALRPEGFLWLGLIAVIALPIGRVIVSGVGFFAGRDRLLTLVSAAVLVVVLASILAALGLEG